MTEPSQAVFLSYASQDAEAARRICEALRSAGIEVWFDQSELRGGDAWDRQIRKQIHDCALFVPIISIHSQARLEGYFRREWKLAADRTHDMAEEKAFLVPVVIDDTTERTASVPDKFKEVQWTRLPAGETPPAFVERVARLLARELQTAQSMAMPPAGPVPLTIVGPQEPKGSTGASWRSQPALLLIAAVVIIGIGYFAVDKIWLPKRVAVGTVLVPAVAPVSPTPNSTPEKSIAVLPFTDLSEKKDQEYFADGMAEEILNLLVKVPELKVIGRTSSFQFKGKTDDLRKIGAALGAAYVVEGSVRRSGDQIRVTAQLIDTRDGSHRWSETYDRDLSDVLKVQDEIAVSLVRALQLEVNATSRFPVQVKLQNNGAYDAYLRGLHARERYDQVGFEQAIADFHRALDLDPSFTPAAEILARTLTNLGTWGFEPPKQAFEEGRAAALMALKINPKSALAHGVLSMIHTWYDWDWSAAEREVRTAMMFEPNDPTILMYAAEQRMAVGQWREATHFHDAAMTADPLHASLLQDASWTYARLSRLTEAETVIRRALEISPTYVGGHHDLGIFLVLAGNPEAALAEMQKETPVGGQSVGLAVVYQALHRTKESQAELAHAEAEHSEDMAMWIAEANAFRGQKDMSFKWLDRAYAQKDIFLWLIKGDPLLKNLEADPRYKAFLHKMNLPE